MTFSLFSTDHARPILEKFLAVLLQLPSCSKTACSIWSFPQVIPHPLYRLIGLTFNGMTRFFKFSTGPTTITRYMNQRFFVVVELSRQHAKEVGYAIQR